jgi:hypothetical protein
VCVTGFGNQHNQSGQFVTMSKILDNLKIEYNERGKPRYVITNAKEANEALNEILTFVYSEAAYNNDCANAVNGLRDYLNKLKEQGK